MTFPVLPNSQRLDHHTVSSPYVKAAIEGYLAAQPSYRCVRAWHLDALAKRLGDGADTAIEQMQADGTLLRLNSTMMPAVFSLGSGVGYITVRALQELAADWRLEAHLQQEVSAWLVENGHSVTTTSERTGDEVAGFRDGHLLGSPRTFG